MQASRSQLKQWTLCLFQAILHQRQALAERQGASQIAGWASSIRHLWIMNRANRWLHKKVTVAFIRTQLQHGRRWICSLRNFRNPWFRTGCVETPWDTFRKSWTRLHWVRWLDAMSLSSDGTATFQQKDGIPAASFLGSPWNMSNGFFCSLSWRSQMNFKEKWNQALCHEYLPYLFSLHWRWGWCWMRMMFYWHLLTKSPMATCARK